MDIESLNLPVPWYRPHRDTQPYLFRRFGTRPAIVHRPEPIAESTPWVMVVDESYMEVVDSLMDGVLLAESIIAETSDGGSACPSESSA